MAVAATAIPHTRLSRALRDRPARRATPVDLFRRARRQWMEGERLDVGALASELGIARATAFRWVGSRELLVGEILWSLCGPLMDQSAAAIRTRGARRVAAICETTIRAILAFAPLRRFMQADPEYALRLLTSKQGPVQGRAIEKVRELLAFESQRGALAPPLGVDTLAYLIVRICESFIYAEAISGQQIDVGDAALAIELLLSGRVKRRRKP
jgi:AcrR family transcriptional regulator